MWLFISPGFFIFLSLIYGSFAVDRANFKTCEQSSFCKRHRKQEVKVEYELVKSTLANNGSALTAELVSSLNKLRLTLVALHDSTLRLLIDDIETLRPRYQPLDALKDGGKFNYARFENPLYESDHVLLHAGKDTKLLLAYKPFRLDVTVKDELIMSVNSRNLLKFEHFRYKDDSNSTIDGEDFWDETFKTHRDSKPHGSSSVGVDISFIGYKYVYGLPEHADSFTLRSTTGTDPYRLYNLDVFEFEIGNQMSLYGSVPFMIAHNKDRSVGLLWLNAAETWVDIGSSTADKGMLRALVDKFKRSSDVPQVDAHFISESGLVDLFLFLGPSPMDVFRQNSALSGVYPLPPLFAIGYQQCRWNYNDEEDVASVHDNFDKHDIPVDAIWLDIEHTDGKRYFTWDPNKFPNPTKMINNLVEKGRKMITIIDPHIKKDDSFHLYKDAKDNGYFVKDREGADYEGHCWPGASMYLDFINPVVREYWANKFAYENYIGATEDLFTWNDMNEPSVFSGPEVTMHKDAKHFGDWEHRDIHNIYGFYVHSSSYNGLKKRTGNKIRPFVLSRSFFIGSQRTTSVWTGDNAASWEHLQSSIPMLLSLSVAGIPHVGADVGGFFGNPDDQLLARWYQAAAFQPFFRSHAHIDTKRREPWLVSDEAREVIRNAIRRRYSFLPYWYTLFYEHSLTGKPVMRPLWAEFTDDEGSFDEEREWLLGGALLVRPVLEPDVTSVSLYLPGRRNVIWYEWNSNKPHPAPGAVYIDTPLNVIPLYQRGGTIIPVRERIRRAAGLMRQDPITLYIAINYKTEFANGTLYLDDGESYDYEKGKFLYWGFTYKKEGDQLYTITSKNLDPSGVLESDVYIEKIILRGVRYYPNNVHIYFDDWNPEPIEFFHNREDQTLTLRQPNAYVASEFRIDIHA